MLNQKFVGNTVFHVEEDDRSSLEAAAEAAAKVNAMLIAKGMLKPNQLNSFMDNVVTKKVGGLNNLVVAEVEINNLSPPCRNTLTRGSTQEEISKASGAAVTTRGRYMAENERVRNTRDRCLYLNVQAAKKESVDIAMQKINDIIKSMGGMKQDPQGMGGLGFHRGGRFRSPGRGNGYRFGFRGQNASLPHPPPLMSLPTPPPPTQPHVQLPPPVQQPQLQLPPPPQTVTILQEKLYVGLEHAPPNFDTKNKLLGPVGSYLQHIQTETGAAVSLRGKGSGFMDLNGADAFEPMHVHIEHPSLIGLQEAKKLAENLIQTVQQSYVSFQQALAALPPSMPTGLITGVPQQPNIIESQLAIPQPGLAPIATVQEQPMQAMQPPGQHMGPPPIIVATGSLPNQISTVPQALTNTVSGHTVVIPSSMGLNQVPVVNSLPVSAPPPIIQQPAPLDLGGQQAMLLSQQPPPQAMASVGLQQMVQTAGQPPPQPVPAPVPAPMAAYASMQHTMQLVSQPVSMASALVQQQPGPALLAPAHTLFAPQQPPVQCLGISIQAPSSVVYTVASSNPPYFSSPKLEEPKRRFTEEKDDKIPENLLGYQHGPPHLVNLLRSSPPPQPVPPPMSQAISQPHSAAQLFQAPPPQGLIMSHIAHEQAQFSHLGGQTIMHPCQAPILAPPSPEGQHVLTQPPPCQSGLAPQFVQGHLPPHLFNHLPPPPSPSPSLGQHLPLPSSPGIDVRPQSRNPSSPTTLMPPPPLPTSIASPVKEEIGEGEKRSATPSKSSPDRSWESGSKRKAAGMHESDKKKMKGGLKNRQNKQLEKESDEKLVPQQAEEEESQDNKRHPASPQYQGQPLRYPNMPSDPNLPPQPQEMGVPRLPQPQEMGIPRLPQPQEMGIPRLPQPQEMGIPRMSQPQEMGIPRLPQSALNPGLLPPPGHHLVQQPDMASQIHHPHPHIHLEAPHNEVAPPAQIMIEHPMPPGPPIHIAHHHRPPAPGQIHLEHSVPSGLPRQLLMEHPPPQPTQMEQPQLIPEHVHSHSHPPPQGVPLPPSHPTHQEMFEFDLGTQQVPPPHPHFQNFEHVPVSISQPEQQPPPPQPQPLLPPGSTVIVSSAPHQYPPQYSVAMSSQATPPVSFAVPSSGGIPIHSQSIHRMPEQQQQQPQMITVPPPPTVVPSAYNNIGVPPTSSPHFQAHFAPHAQPLQGAVLHQQPPTTLAPPPVVSQPPQYQTHPQGIPFWVSQA